VASAFDLETVPVLLLINPHKAVLEKRRAPDEASIQELIKIASNKQK
jgi:hypothetical protein